MLYLARGWELATFGYRYEPAHHSHCEGKVGVFGRRVNWRVTSRSSHLQSDGVSRT